MRTSVKNAQNTSKFAVLFAVERKQASERAFYFAYTCDNVLKVQVLNCSVYNEYVQFVTLPESNLLKYVFFVRGLLGFNIGRVLVNYVVTLQTVALKADPVSLDYCFICCRCYNWFCIIILFTVSSVDVHFRA